MSTNKMVNIIKPYMIVNFDITRKCKRYNAPYIESYDEIVWPMYALFKAFNFVHIGGEADA